MMMPCAARAGGLFCAPLAPQRGKSPCHNLYFIPCAAAFHRGVVRSSEHEVQGAKAARTAKAGHQN